MADYIPGGDVAFNAWLDNFVTYASANLANFFRSRGWTRINADARRIHSAFIRVHLRPVLAEGGGHDPCHSAKPV